MKSILLLAFIFMLGTVAVNGQTVQKAKASYYHSKFNGRKTASGDTYWDHFLTAASNIYKLGTKLLITNPITGKSVQVLVNDRMAPHIKGRVDLSKAAYKEIASLSTGITPVHIEVVDGDKKKNENL
ncbi:MAG: septal ring lytic transglycosylase RlpA family protein [Niabella sp.]